jgi:hypothetical protein
MAPSFNLELIDAVFSDAATLPAIVRRCCWIHAGILPPNQILKITAQKKRTPASRTVGPKSSKIRRSAFCGFRGIVTPAKPVDTLRQRSLLIHPPFQVAFFFLEKAFGRYFIILIFTVLYTIAEGKPFFALEGRQMPL